MNRKWMVASGVLAAVLTASAGHTATVQAPAGRDEGVALRWTGQPAASPAPALVAARSEAPAGQRRGAPADPFAAEVPQPAASAVPGDGAGSQMAIWVLALLSGGVLLDWIRRGWPR